MSIIASRARAEEQGSPLRETDQARRRDSGHRSGGSNRAPSLQLIIESSCILETQFDHREQRPRRWWFTVVRRGSRRPGECLHGAEGEQHVPRR